MIARLRSRLRLASPLLLTALLPCGPAHGASVPAATRVEVVAAVPAGDEALPGPPPRQQVVVRGIEEAVRDVVLAYLSVPLDDEADPLETIGGRPRDFVLRYRVLERIGERPTLSLIDEPEPPALEYAARIEVHVDTPRLTAALAAAGLWLPAEVETGSGTYWIEAPLHWSAWAAFRQALLAAGADRVVPEEVSAEGMLVRVDGGRGDPASIVARVSAEPPEGLEVEGPELGEPPRLRIRKIAPETGDAAPLD